MPAPYRRYRHYRGGRRFQSADVPGVSHAWPQSPGRETAGHGRGDRSITANDV